MFTVIYLNKINKNIYSEYCGEKYVQGDELQFVYRKAFGKRSCERCAKSLRKIKYGNEGIVCEGGLCFFVFKFYLKESVI